MTLLFAMPSLQLIQKLNDEFLPRRCLLLFASFGRITDNIY
jgi:hypothetical protein